MKIGVGSHSTLQGIFPTQVLKLGVLHCGQILYHLNDQETPDNTVNSYYLLITCNVPGLG